MALAIDGSLYFANTFGGSATIASPGLTTTNANDIIILSVLNLGATINSVTGASIGSFTRIGASSGGSPPAQEIWACVAPSALTGEVVTIVQAQNFDCRYNLFGVSGTGQTSLTGIFETFIGNELGAFNGSMPQNYTTTHADTMIIGGSAVGFGSIAATANNGFAFVVTPTDPLAVIYKVLSATSTESLSHNQDNLCNNMLGFAIIKAAAGGDVLASQIWL